jgi:S-adenosylmethionine:tRNA ribosyltransferase-isomerase
VEQFRRVCTPVFRPVQPASHARPAPTPSPISTFVLPPELIAQHPAPERSASRLLDGRGALPVDRSLPRPARAAGPGDLLVFNDTRVIKARLLGEKPTGGAVEALVERVLPGHEVLAHLRASKSPQARQHRALRRRLRRRGARPRQGPTTRCSTCASRPTRWCCSGAHGHVPLPPYITHADDADDAERYQTVFADKPGAVAAPTASLHFDAAVLAALAKRGVQRAA